LHLQGRVPAGLRWKYELYGMEWVQLRLSTLSRKNISISCKAKLFLSSFMLVRKSNKPCACSKVAITLPQLHLLKNSEDLLSTVKMRQRDSVSPASSDFHLASGKIGTKHSYPLCKHDHCWA
jgi:hypothetical protein